MSQRERVCPFLILLQRQLSLSVLAAISSKLEGGSPFFEKLVTPKVLLLIASDMRQCQERPIVGTAQLLVIWNDTKK